MIFVTKWFLIPVEYMNSEITIWPPDDIIYLTITIIEFSKKERWLLACGSSTDFPKIQESAPFSFWHWAPIESIHVFPAIKISMILYMCTCIHYGLSVKINTWKATRCPRLVHAFMPRSWAHFVCVYLHMCSWQGPEYPQLELHGWQCHYRGRYRSSCISGLNLWAHYDFREPTEMFATLNWFETQMFVKNDNFSLLNFQSAVMSVQSCSTVIVCLCWYNSFASRLKCSTRLVLGQEKKSLVVLHRPSLMCRTDPNVYYFY